MRFQRALAWIFAAVLVAAAVTAVAQAFGATSLWAVWGGAVRQDRVPGTTGSPLNLGALGLLSLWALASLRHWPRWSPTWLAATLASLSGGVCVAMSVSRAAALAYGVGVVALAVLWIRQRWRNDWLVLGVVLLVAASASAAYAAGPGDSLSSRAMGGLGGLASSDENRWLGGGLTSSDEKRMMLWGEAGRAIADSPLTGVGSGAFMVADRLYRPAAERIAMPWQAGADAHSLPLLLAAGSGLPGLLLGGALVALIVLRLWRRGAGVLRREPRGAADGVAVGAPRLDEGITSAAALIYLLAAAAFVAVSPLDAAVAIPAIVLAAAACGAPQPSDRFSWTLARPGGRAGVIVRGAALGLASVVLAGALVSGAQW
ncbi:MAG TPA: O-antigen ligase family protein [Thermoleophilia bacterium]|nr:O-antigen ligase family protein [Thermoleophilia bacterium]